MKMNQFFVTLSTLSLLALPVTTLAESTDTAAPETTTVKPTRIELLEQKMKSANEKEAEHLEKRKMQLNSVAKLQSLNNECRVARRASTLAAEKEFIAAQKKANEAYRAAMKAAQDARKTALEAARTARKTALGSLGDVAKQCEKNAKDAVSQPTTPAPATPAAETTVNTPVTQ